MSCSASTKAFAASIEAECAGVRFVGGRCVWLEFDPQAGHEQAGHRPAVVLSPARHNSRAGMIVCCPTTTRIKGYPFEVALTGTPPSVVLADQVKSQDWRARTAGQPYISRRQR